MHFCSLNTVTLIHWAAYNVCAGILMSESVLWREYSLHLLWHFTHSFICGDSRGYYIFSYFIPKSATVFSVNILLRPLCFQGINVVKRIRLPFRLFKCFSALFLNRITSILVLFLYIRFFSCQVWFSFKQRFATFLTKLFSIPPFWWSLFSWSRFTCCRATDYWNECRLRSES